MTATPLTPENTRILDTLLEFAWAPPSPARAWHIDGTPAELYCLAAAHPHSHKYTFLPRTIIGIGSNREEALANLRDKVTSAILTATSR